MAEKVIVYWRDIPAQVIVRRGRERQSRELSARFTEAIDAAAMRSGARDSEAYLAEWRRGDGIPCGEDLAGEAEAAIAAIEAAYPAERVAMLVRQDGREAAP